MYALVIGASSEAVFAIKEAQSMGLVVLGFDGDENAVGLNYVDEKFIVDIRKPENICAILEEKGIKEGDMVVLPVPIGRYLISAGEVNDHYHLKGVSKVIADRCTDKFLFHQILSKANLRNVESNLVEAGEIPEFEPEFPVIAKPRYGAGSRSVFQISDMQEWIKFREESPFEEDFIIEKAVAGEEYGIDGMVIDNVFYLVLLRKKIVTEPPARQCVAYFAVVENEKNYAIIEVFKEYLQQIIVELGISDGIIHADLMYDGEKPFIIELSARPSGHRLHDLFTPKVTGINMIKEYLRHALFGQCALTSGEMNKCQVPYMIHYFDMSDCIIKQIPDEKELKKKFPIEEYQCNLKVGYVPKVLDGKSLMSRGYFVLRGDDEDVLRRYGKEIVNEFLK